MVTHKDSSLSCFSSPASIEAPVLCDNSDFCSDVIGVHGDPRDPFFDSFEWAYRVLKDAAHATMIAKRGLVSDLFSTLAYRLHTNRHFDAVPEQKPGQVGKLAGRRYDYPDDCDGYDESRKRAYCS